MNQQFIVISISDKHFIALVGVDKTIHTLDHDIANQLNMDTFTYNLDLKEKFNSHLEDIGNRHYQAFFTNRQDAEKAISEYLEPKIVMMKLSGKEA